MITLDQARTLSGKTLIGSGGEKLGTIDTLYADRDGGEPTFATVHTGLFGAKTHFVPLADATLAGRHRHRPLRARPSSSDAPNIDPDGELSPEEEQRLYSHYGVGGGAGATTATHAAPDGDADVRQHARHTSATTPAARPPTTP